MRVGAYYHDIGKLTHPEFFTENKTHYADIDGKTGSGTELPATMSALIIRSHPKDGVEYCKDYNLPEFLHKFVLEHHGTSKIEYFLNKMREERKDETMEGDFRYAGPRPQIKGDGYSYDG